MEDTRMRNRRAAAFSLVELLVVMGLISVLISLLIPVTVKVRAASHATACMSNLRQMGNAWTVYTTENKGHLLPYVWELPESPEIAWRSYWPGVLERWQVHGTALLCPTASETLDDPAKRGYGNATHAWTGKFTMSGTVVKLTQEQYRDGSYGYNRYMSAGWGQGLDMRATKVAAVKSMSEVPLFMDCTYVDVAPENGRPASKVSPPPDLHGGGGLTDPEHW